MTQAMIAPNGPVAVPKVRGREKIPDPTMDPTTNGRSARPPEPAEALDPVAEAEALKAALQEALNRSARLIASLRQFRKQHRAVQSAMASLKQLQLTP